MSRLPRCRRRTASLASIVAAVAMTLGAVGNAGAATLLNGLGGPAGYGPNNLPGNDDGSTGVIDISAAFPEGLHFYAATYRSLFVNNNGNITFGAALGAYTPNPFPIASQPMIAPWWGDVDTRGGGVPDRNGVYWSVTPGRFVATWHNVGYFASHDDLLNDFQLILTAGGPGIGDFDVEFRYHECRWTTGDASGGMGGFGGTPAQAGFDAGNLRDFVTLPGSRSMAVLALCSTSNVAMPGVWRYSIRGGAVRCPGQGSMCTTGRPGACGPGTIMCRGTEGVCVGPEPAPERCDGIDNDCSGATDEGLGSTSCGRGACAVTVANCVGGRVQMCTPGVPRPESCNGIDDDCNGVVDDAPPATCGSGACRVAQPACESGRPRVCVPGSPSPEVCNGIDDDCNGAIDEGLDACMAVPPDAPPEAGPDAAVVDGSADVPPGECEGWRCRPDLLLQGRAGPLGCQCSAPGAPNPRSSAGLSFVFAIVVAFARRTRRQQRDRRLR